MKFPHCAIFGSTDKFYEQGGEIDLETDLTENHLPNSKLNHA